MDDDTKGASPKDRDLLYVHSKGEHGNYRVLRSRADQIEVGELRALAEGRPIVGELVKLTPTEEHASVFDVEVLMDARADAAEDKAAPKAAALKKQRAHPGPARVATGAYRSGWDRVFGGRDDDLPN